MYALQPLYAFHCKVCGVTKVTNLSYCSGVKSTISASKIEEWKYNVIENRNTKVTSSLVTGTIIF